MIRFLDHDEIDKVLWDNGISRACNGNLYGFSWYLDKIGRAHV